MADLLQQCNEILSDKKLIRPGSSVLLAVSGGLDSMVMLNIFHRLISAWNLRIGIVHVHHMLRGSEADRDELVVRNAAKYYGLVYYCGRMDTNNNRVVEKGSFEEAARRLRYRFLHQIRAQGRYDSVAIAHHANDQAETILMNMIRGGGIRGLGGMNHKRDCFIRPLLTIRREALEFYANENNLKFINDSSNRSNRYLRNRVRNELLNAFEKSAGRSAVDALCRSADICREIENDLDRFADDALFHSLIRRKTREIVLDIDKILTYFKSVQKHIFIRILRQFFKQSNINFHEIERLAALVSGGTSGSIIKLRGNITVTRSQNTLTFKSGIAGTTCFDIMPGKSYSFEIFNMDFESRIMPAKSLKKFVIKSNNEEAVDFDLLTMPLKLRSAMPGEWFIPLGMQGRKKVYDFFKDEKIPLPQREQVPVITAGEDIVWIVGYRLDDRFKVNASTKKILHMRMTAKSGC